MSNTQGVLAGAVSRRSFLATSAIAGASVAGSGALLAACGGGGGGTPAPGGSASGGAVAQTSGGQVSWSAWANPGEAERFRQYSKEYETKTGTKVTFQVTTGDYLAKLLTQLAGGSATDAFYAGDDQLGKLIESGNVAPLDDYLASPEAATKWEDTYTGLRQWTKGADGKIYGLIVDCNPIVQWFNKVVLQKAGVTTDPAAQQEAGTWTLDAMADILAKTKAVGLTGGVVESGWWGFWMGYLSSQGGTLFDESGKAVFNTDPKSLAGLEWLLEQLKNGNMKYGGALPKGQGVDALFYAGQMAMLGYGRWVLPNLKKLNKANVDYDIAPMPSADGKSIAPVPVGTASITVNGKAKNQATGFAFVGNYVNADGQRFRLSGGGNAVPTQKGLEDIVTEGNDPAHGAWFNDAAANGFGTPKAIYSDPVKGAGLPKQVQALLMPDALPSTTAQSFADTICNFLNA